MTTPILGLGKQTRVYVRRDADQRILGLYCSSYCAENDPQHTGKVTLSTGVDVLPRDMGASLPQSITDHLCELAFCSRCGGNLRTKNNARRIAAAPELLDALRELLTQSGCVTHEIQSGPACDYCATHSPIAIASRKHAADARYQEKLESRRRERLAPLERVRNRCATAAQIAAERGESPAGIAAAVLRVHFEGL